MKKKVTMNKKYYSGRKRVKMIIGMIIMIMTSLKCKTRKLIRNPDLNKQNSQSENAAAKNTDRRNCKERLEEQKS